MTNNDSLYNKCYVVKIVKKSFFLRYNKGKTRLIWGEIWPCWRSTQISFLSLTRSAYFSARALASQPRALCISLRKKHEGIEEAKKRSACVPSSTAQYEHVARLATPNVRHRSSQAVRYDVTAWSRPVFNTIMTYDSFEWIKLWEIWFIWFTSVLKYTLM